MESLFKRNAVHYPCESREQHVPKKVVERRIIPLLRQDLPHFVLVFSTERKVKREIPRPIPSISPAGLASLLGR
ncbi:hypothetical protein MPNT_10004 [Candidatus Methylacidithermus pantelleriae]|uniref:Uncharacterized protein n=1 Tax=Candidatus Methylacidithermus pantelleriae TaxID=2744239 RepID=A0A8J2BI87_9BACT|nr:hypothetical protein MPNT_10004 [Candidatus Methylacidithermus pantelleriae]